MLVPDEEEEGSSALGLETMQLQWESYVRNLKQSGTLSNALAVADVSGSMSGLPMQVSTPAKKGSVEQNHGECCALSSEAA